MNRNYFHFVLYFLSFFYFQFFSSKLIVYDFQMAFLFQLIVLRFFKCLLQFANFWINEFVERKAISHLKYHTHKRMRIILINSILTACKHTIVPRIFQRSTKYANGFWISKSCSFEQSVFIHLFVVLVSWMVHAFFQLLELLKKIPTKKSKIHFLTNLLDYTQ